MRKKGEKERKKWKEKKRESEEHGQTVRQTRTQNKKEIKNGIKGKKWQPISDLAIQTCASKCEQGLISTMAMMRSWMTWRKRALNHSTLKDSFKVMNL